MPGMGDRCFGSSSSGDKSPRTSRATKGLVDNLSNAPLQTPSTDAGEGPAGDQKVSLGPEHATTHVRPPEYTPTISHTRHADFDSLP